MANSTSLQPSGGASRVLRPHGQTRPGTPRPPSRETSERNRRWLATCRRVASRMAKRPFSGSMSFGLQDGVIQYMRVRDDVPGEQTDGGTVRISVEEFIDELTNHCLVGGFFGEAMAEFTDSAVRRYSFERFIQEPLC